MKEFAKKSVARTKKFVNDHKVGLAFTAGAIIGFGVMQPGRKAMDEFLTERGLYDEYYHPTDENGELL